jgi:NodT family efflux transporter outer membrane factor (OMF) lipoprotein
MNKNPVLRLAIIIGLALSLCAGCISKARKISVPIEVAQAFSDSGQKRMPRKWWTAFQDPRLNVLVDRALKSNLDLKSAWQRLRAAQAVVGREFSSLLPDLDANLRGETGRTDSESAVYEDLELSLSSEYELDLWGKIRSQVQAQRYQAKASFTDYQTVALSIAAELTRTYYKLVEAHNQIDLIENQINTNEKMLSLIRVRVGSGQVRGVDILRQKQLIESTREQKISWEARARILEHQLSVLLGNPPRSEFGPLIEHLPDLPLLPETGIPAELIRRRPDVQSAFYRVQAADRELASALSSRYPRLSISASLSSSAENTGDLFKNWAYSLVSNLLAPIFYGGRLRADAKRTRAVKEQLLNEYGQTILTAFQEIEDSLIQEKKQLKRIQSIKKQVALARQTSEQLRIEYFNGIADYLDVLTVNNNEQRLRRDLLSAHLSLLEYRISLYRALAGGFETNLESKNGAK